MCFSVCVCVCACASWCVDCLSQALAEIQRRLPNPDNGAAGDSPDAVGTLAGLLSDVQRAVAHYMTVESWDDDVIGSLVGGLRIVSSCRQPAYLARLAPVVDVVLQQLSQWQDAGGTLSKDVTWARAIMTILSSFNATRLGGTAGSAPAGAVAVDWAAHKELIRRLAVLRGVDVGSLAALIGK